MRTRAPGTSRRIAALVGGAVVLLLAGCVSLPDSGQVRTRSEDDLAQHSDAVFEYTPPGPVPGGTRVDVVDGFLQAMQAAPASSAVAREFLTDEGSTSWVPEEGTLVYGSHLLAESASTVTARLQDTVALDARGAWLGRTEGRDQSYRLTLVREKGEWRISDPPNRLMVPRVHFESRYQQYFLYYFDRSAQILVPEPVYLPRGEQAPTLLVRRLLRGPDPRLPGVTRTFVPSGTELELSVPVGAEGSAEVPLSTEVLELGADDLQMLQAQIAWTLRQIPGIETLRITVDGAPLDTPGEGDRRSVHAWTEYDPSIHWASQELFGIRDRRVVALSADADRQVEGRFGGGELDVRSLAADLPGEQVAAVTQDGRSLLLARRERQSGSRAEPVRTVYSGGTDLTRPAWDIYGQVWLLDRTSAGAALMVLRAGVPERVEVPGVSGRRVTAFTVSRDGTRLAAVVDDRAGDRLVLSRVARRDDGRVRSVTRAVELSVGAGARPEIVDLAWSTPGSLALLVRSSAGTSQVEQVLVDGSVPLPDAAIGSEVFAAVTDRLVASPAPATPVYLVTPRSQVYELGGDGQWAKAPIRGGLTAPVYVG